MDLFGEKFKVFIPENPLSIIIGNNIVLIRGRTY